jgi:hypothetical protein
MAFAGRARQRVQFGMALYDANPAFAAAESAHLGHAGYGQLFAIVPWGEVFPAPRTKYVRRQRGAL